MAQADAEVEQHDHAEVHRIDAEILHHREQDRRRDQNRRRMSSSVPSTSSRRALFLMANISLKIRDFS
jgi:hypothetical protein